MSKRPLAPGGVDSRGAVPSESAPQANSASQALRSRLQQIATLYDDLAAVHRALAEEVQTSLAAFAEASLYTQVETTPKLEFLATKDVAELLRVSPRTVRRMVDEGRLPAAVQITPGRSLWRRSDLDAWFESEAGRG